MPDLKDIYTKEKIYEIAVHFQNEASHFPVDDFVNSVFVDDWDILSLRQRHMRLAKAAYTSLGMTYQETCAILQRLNDYANGFSYLFLLDIISMYGLNDFDTSFKTMGVLTTGSSAEFAIRLFLETDFNKTFKQMQSWAHSENFHHRRLASEGLRPHLPWGKKVAEINAHRKEIFELLDILKSDTSVYVQKSVANHVNDWSKEYPEKVLDLLEGWQGVSKQTDWIVKHAARTLLKQGHPRALKLLGYQTPTHVIIEFKVPDVVTQGELSHVMYRLSVADDFIGKIHVALQVGFMKKRGVQSYKIFVLKDTVISSNKIIEGTWTYHWVDKTIRKHYNGIHVFQLVINGKVTQVKEVMVKGFSPSE